MQGRVIRIVALLSFMTPAFAFALINADPEPMKPVEKDKRRIVERGNDRGRDQGGDRDRTRGRDDDRGIRRGVDRGTTGFRRPGSRGDGQWVLGLTGDDTDVGVRVTNVLRGSAAERAGLERDDVIVNVGGYQVGVVDGQRFDLGDELQRQGNRAGDVDRPGRVVLLIQNRRDRRLQNVVVQLEWVQARAHVQGTVNYRERIALPPDAVCFVELVEVDVRGRAVRVLEKQLIRMGTASSAAYDIEYDPRGIEPNRRYAVQARIEMNGRLLMDTPDTYYVITQGSPDRADLLLNTRVIRRGPGGGHRGNDDDGVRIRKR
ncbi:MAG: YbaY family lipoprotein [Phycisphaerales bacterium]|nr:YbaY family lipoprotein [Phycisphaerales bacterium]